MQRTCVFFPIWIWLCVFFGRMSFVVYSSLSRALIPPSSPTCHRGDNGELYYPHKHILDTFKGGDYIYYTYFFVLNAQKKRDRFTMEICLFLLWVYNFCCCFIHCFRMKECGKYALGIPFYSIRWILLLLYLFMFYFCIQLFFFFSFCSRLISTMTKFCFLVFIRFVHTV